ncbi:hypothetical protein PC123_g16903 [Phytophthora cactorum]|nr:hypothetical protein PC123_g16903 [Phytophthora cactorum]
MASASSYQLAPAMIKTTDYTWNSALTNIDGDVGHWITHNLDEELASSVAEPVTEDTPQAYSLRGFPS